MKKIVAILTICILCMAVLMPFTVSAASASASLTYNGTVRAGDTITLTFNINGSNLSGASGTLSYDSNQLTLVGTTQKIASPWAVEFNGNTFVAYDNNLSSPINGNKALFTVSFKVKSLAVGTKVNVSYTDVRASDGKGDAKIGTVTYSTTIAAPLSTNNNLAALNVNNATISPAFSANVTNYTASVPFSVSKLDISAAAADSKAKIALNNPNLVPNGTTKVTITVTAENGAKKTYTITVTRAQDPNYQANGNNNLSNITVDGFLLSPVFSADRTQYVVWVPFETTSVRVNGTPDDNKASVSVEGGDTLAAGQDNPVKVICTAENGTTKEYTVVVKRAASHDGTVDALPTPTATPDPTETIDGVTPTDAPVIEDQATEGVAFVWLIVVGVAALAVGCVIGIVIGKGKKN